MTERCRVTEDLRAYMREQDAQAERVERALHLHRTEAMDKLRDDAVNDADAIRDVLATLAAPELERIATAALTGDLQEIGRIVAKPLASYVRARESDESEIESEALQMLGDEDDYRGDEDADERRERAALAAMEAE